MGRPDVTWNGGIIVETVGMEGQSSIPSGVLTSSFRKNRDLNYFGVNHYHSLNHIQATDAGKHSGPMRRITNVALMMVTNESSHI
jgi:hypothetical protein